MKNLIILSVFALVLFGCNKITESNIVGTWKVTQLNINGIDMPLTGSESMEFKSNGEMIVFDPSGNSYGTYTVDKSAQTITMTVDGETNTTSVSDKKGNKMTWNYTVDGSAFVVQLEKQ